MENAGKFEEMLDMLMDEYPNLKDEAMALKDSLSAEGKAPMEGEEDMAAEEEPVMPGAFKAIPPELEDEESEEEGEEEEEEEEPLF